MPDPTIARGAAVSEAAPAFAVVSKFAVVYDMEDSLPVAAYTMPGEHSYGSLGRNEGKACHSAGCHKEV